MIFSKQAALNITLEPRQKQNNKPKSIFDLIEKQGIAEDAVQINGTTYKELNQRIGPWISS